MSKINWFCTLQYALSNWLKNIAPRFHPIRGKTKTNVIRLHAFLTLWEGFASAASYYLEFWLVHCFVCALSYWLIICLIILVLWSIYEMIHIWTSVVDESEEWSSQSIFQFKQSERGSLEKSGLQRDSNPWPQSINWPRSQCVAS